MPEKSKLSLSFLNERGSFCDFLLRQEPVGKEGFAGRPVVVITNKASTLAEAELGLITEVVEEGLYVVSVNGDSRPVKGADLYLLKSLWRVLDQSLQNLESSTKRNEEHSSVLLSEVRQSLEEEKTEVARLKEQEEELENRKKQLDVLSASLLDQEEQLNKKMKDLERDLF